MEIPWKPKIALVIGHSPNDPGAVNTNYKISEWKYNSGLAEQVAALVSNAHVTVIPGDDTNEYIARINRERFDCALELHCNGAENPNATGTETLFWHNSMFGEFMAEKIQARVVEALGLRNRGLKEIFRGQRGWPFLMGTHCPAVIAEPFFITTDLDLKIGLKKRSFLVSAYVAALDEISGTLAK